MFRDSARLVRLRRHSLLRYANHGRRRRRQDNTTQVPMLDLTAIEAEPMDMCVCVPCSTGKLCVRVGCERAFMNHRTGARICIINSCLREGAARARGDRVRKLIIIEFHRKAAQTARSASRATQPMNNHNIPYMRDGLVADGVCACVCDLCSIINHHNIRLPTIFNIGAVSRLNMLRSV